MIRKIDNFYINTNDFPLLNGRITFDIPDAIVNSVQKNINIYNYICLSYISVPINFFSIPKQYEFYISNVPIGDPISYNIIYI